MAITFSMKKQQIESRVRVNCFVYFYILISTPHWISKIVRLKIEDFKRLIHRALEPLESYFTSCVITLPSPPVFAILYFSIQHVSIHSKSLLTVHPQETNKSSMYYVMQMLKGALPTVLVKVIHFSFLLRFYFLNICVGKGVISSLPRKRFLSKDFLCSVLKKL